ncbi:MAG: CBS domain-containing protein [Planctomycetales bacterium]
MSTHIVVLTEEMSIPEAAQVLLEQHISGAPVSDSQGNFVGLLSLSDLVQPRPAHFENQRVLLREDREAHTAVLGEACRQPSGELVRERMSRNLISVTEEAPLIEVARIMCDGHWHRVAVLDGENKLVGIVSTMDVLAALVNAADEAYQR